MLFRPDNTIFDVWAPLINTVRKVNKKWTPLFLSCPLLSTSFVKVSYTYGRRKVTRSYFNGRPAFFFPVLLAPEN
jgi:hypothetical protein